MKKLCCALAATLYLSSPAWAGLDVYSGSLTKFYKNDYLSVQASTALEFEMEFKTVYPNGEPEWLTDKNAEKRLNEFKSTLGLFSSENELGFSNWSEDHDEYFIEQLNWDCLAALIHIAAYAIRTDLERPIEFSGDYTAYSAFTEAVDNDYYIGPLAVLESDLFVPGEGASIFIIENPLEEEVVVTSTQNLKRTLDFLNQAVWEGKAQPEKWFARGPASLEPVQEMRVSKGTDEPELIEVTYPPENNDLAKHNAEYAYSVLLKAIKYSTQNNVPIAMDG
jgi:hypothetical protein